MNLGLLGYSGHAYVVAEAIIQNGHTLVGYANKFRVEQNPFEIKYLGDENQLDFLGWKLCESFVLGIGNNIAREKDANLVKAKGYECLTIIHPEASVSSYSKIGKGVFVARNVSINPMCEIGDNAIINTSASIDHECRVLAGAHIAPGAVLAGNVTIGEKSFIGANSIVKEGIAIGKNVTIGAGAVVIDDVGEGMTLVGNPARKL